MIRKYGPFLLIAAGSITLLLGLTYYLSPFTRLELYGIRLSHRLAHQGPAHFIIGWDVSAESWTEREGRLDTPLLKETLSEVSTIVVHRSMGSDTKNVLHTTVDEWSQSSTSADVVKNAMIPQNHPSISGGTILLDKQGTLLERESHGAWRMDRVLQFLVPRFPKGAQRLRSTWTEHLTWVEMLDDWKVRWDADLTWRLEGFETRYDHPCATLAYSAELHPTILQDAYWAKGAAGPPHFSGSGEGKAIYNVDEKMLISNSFQYTGRLEIPIQRLDLIPEDLRIGLPISNDSGILVFKLKDKLNIQRP